MLCNLISFFANVTRLLILGVFFLFLFANFEFFIPFLIVVLIGSVVGVILYKLKILELK